MSRGRKKQPRWRPTEAFCCLFRVERAEFSQLGRVTDLRDEPRFRSDIRRHLLLNRLADWRRPEGNGVTRLSDGDVVLASVLTEEQPLFAVKQTGEVQPAYRHIDFKFHLSFFPLLFVFIGKRRASLDYLPGILSCLFS